MRNHRSLIALGGLLLGTLAGCRSDSATATDSDIRAAELLHFLRPAIDAPPLANPVVSFWAKRGSDREAFLYYQPRPGRTDSSEFMRFKVPGAALDRRPDGTQIATGDSLLITIRVVDPTRLILDFQPSGLRFAAGQPAELKIKFSETDHDLNGDGVVDADDAARELQLSIWKQELPGLPWIRVASSVEVTLEQVEAKVLGFTGYAIAY